MLVRSGRGLAPTPRALALREQVRNVVEQAQAVLGAFGQDVNLATLERIFTLRANDVFVGGFGGRLREHLRRYAPRTTLRFVSEGEHDSGALDDDADLYIGSVQKFGADIKVQTLFTTNFHGLARSGHAIFHGVVTPRRFAAYEHIGVSRAPQPRPDRRGAGRAGAEPPRRADHAHVLRGHLRAGRLRPDPARHAWHLLPGVKRLGLTCAPSTCPSTCPPSPWCRPGRRAWTATRRTAGCGRPSSRSAATPRKRRTPRHDGAAAIPGFPPASDAMTLIDRYLPRYQFHEHHSRPLAATPARAMAAVQAYRPEQDPFFRCAIALRELPVRAFNQLRARPTPTRPPFGLDDFTLLDRDGDRELAYGLIGRFWRAGYDLIPCADGPAFLACRTAARPDWSSTSPSLRSRTANCFCPPKPACTAPTAPACCASRRTGR